MAVSDNNNQQSLFETEGENDGRMEPAAVHSGAPGGNDFGHREEMAVSPGQVGESAMGTQRFDADAGTVRGAPGGVAGAAVAGSSYGLGAGSSAPLLVGAASGQAGGDAESGEAESSGYGAGESSGRVSGAGSVFDSASSAGAGREGMGSQALLEPVTFVPTGQVLVPSGPQARAEANLDAIELVKRLNREQRPATAEEQQTLAKFSSWGASADIFDERNESFAPLRQRMVELMDKDEISAARATTLNAHYTDPAVVAAMWSVMENAGFESGAVLEPGCGSGNFIGAAPAGAQMIGVELDTMSAQIAHYLYPKSTVYAEGFENVRLPIDTLSAAIGNVPFGDFSVADRVDNTESLSIHNYFINKSMRRLAPGGYGMFVTTAFTMDGKEARSRAAIAEHSDLVAAVRLPDHAFKDVAGRKTKVVTDILVFRRREDDVIPNRPAQAQEWVNGFVKQVSVEGRTNEVATSIFFDQNPQYVLGEKVLEMDQFGKYVYRVKSADRSEVLAARIKVALNEQIQAAMAKGLGYEPKLVPTADVKLSEFAPGGLKSTVDLDTALEGTVRYNAGLGQIQRFDSLLGVWEPVKAKSNRDGSSERERRALIGLKEQIRLVLNAPDESQREPELVKLNDLYDSYVAEYGFINRFTLAQGAQPKKSEVNRRLKELRESWVESQDTEGLSRAEIKELEPEAEVLAQWEEEASAADGFRKVQGHLAFLRTDSDYGKLLALEDFNDDEQVGRKSKLFDSATYAGKERVESVDTAEDALSISLDEYRRVDLERIAELLGTDEAGAREQLGELVYTEPGSGELVPAVQYLSGNVRVKLEVAEEAAALDPAFDVNVDALKKIQPSWAGIEKIHLQVGAPYLSESQYRQFVEDTFGVTLDISRTPENDGWTVPHRNAQMDAVVRHTYGTTRRGPADLLDAVMNNRQPKVFDKVTTESGATKNVLNEKETRLARKKAAKIEYAFRQWVAADPARVTQVEREFNQMFNSYVAPDYKGLGERLALADISPQFTPHPYQREAVARIVNEPSVLLDHVVGAGKTGTMIMAAMELRRRGIANKPMFVVPNHLVEQITREFAQWAPTSNVLMIPTGVSAEERKVYAAKSLAGDWDAVIMPQSVFNRVNISAGRQTQFLREDIDNLLEQKKAATGDDLSVKAIERIIKRKETRMKKLMDRKDDGVAFEELGCDYLFVDEAHDFKNLARSSDYQELSCAGSMRASDLDFILRALREDKIAASGGENVVPAVATFATGTPVANSLSELWVMMHYLRPDLTEQLGVPTIDAWARVFTKAEAAMEVQPSGLGFRIVNKVSEYQNLEQLMQIVSMYTSTVVREQIPQKLPTVVGGGMRTVNREASAQVAKYMEGIVSSMQNPAVGEYLIEILGRARRVALDSRMVGLPADADGGRPAQVAGEVMRIHQEYESRQYLDSSGELSSMPGGLQVIFCDQGAPGTGATFNMYDAMKEELILAGMAPERIAYIHDAKDDLERAELFARCRNGEVSVLIGSTQKMGTGMNVQDRLTAIHHVDIPWRPADLEQREGRAIRQGNQNDEVEILTYGTAGTFDAYNWQVIARKHKALVQLKSVGGVQSMESLAGEGDPVLMIASLVGEDAAEYMVLSAEVQNLLLQRSNEVSDSKELGFEIQTLKQRISGQEQTIELYRSAAEYAAHPNDPLVIGDQVFDSRSREASAQVLKGLALAHIRGSKDKGTYFEFGKVGNVPVAVSVDALHGNLVVQLVDPVSMRVLPGAGYEVKPHELSTGNVSGQGQLARMFNMAAKLPQATEELEAHLERNRSQLVRLEEMEASADEGFSQQELLDEKLMRLDVLAQALNVPSLNVDDFDEDGREADAEAIISDEEKALLYGEDPDFSSARLRAGDVIEVTKKHELSPRGLYRVYLEHPVTGEPHERGWKYLVETEADISNPDTQVYELNSLTEYTHVTRLYSSLDAAEKTLLAMAETDALVNKGDGTDYSANDVKVGDKLTLFVPVDGADADYGPHRPVKVTVDKVAPEPESYRVMLVHGTDEEGKEHQVRFTRRGAETAFIHHDVVDLEAKAAAEAAAKAEAEADKVLVKSNRLYPGDMLARTIEGLGARGDVWDGRSSFVHPEYQKGPAYRYGFSALDEATRAHGLSVEDIVPGRDLDEAEKIAVLGELASSARVRDLRVGDVVELAKLDPKAGRAGQVRISSISGWSRKDIYYRFVDDPVWAETSVATRMDSTVIGGVLERRYASLTLPEKASLADAQVRQVLLAEADDIPVGSWVTLIGEVDEGRRRYSGVFQEADVLGNERALLTVEVEGKNLQIEARNDSSTNLYIFLEGTPADIDYRGVSLDSLGTSISATEFEKLPGFVVAGFGEISELERPDEVEVEEVVASDEPGVTVTGSHETVEPETVDGDDEPSAESYLPGEESPVIELTEPVELRSEAGEVRVEAENLDEIRVAVIEATDGLTDIDETGKISTQGISADSPRQVVVARAALAAAGVETAVAGEPEVKNLLPGERVKIMLGEYRLVAPLGRDIILPAVEAQDAVAGTVDQVDVYSGDITLTVEDAQGHTFVLSLRADSTVSGGAEVLEAYSAEHFDTWVNRGALLRAYGQAQLADVQVGDRISSDSLREYPAGRSHVASVNEALVLAVEGSDQGELVLTVADGDDIRQVAADQLAQGWVDETFTEATQAKALDLLAQYTQGRTWVPASLEDTVVGDTVIATGVDEAGVEQTVKGEVTFVDAGTATADSRLNVDVQGEEVTLSEVTLAEPVEATLEIVDETPQKEIVAHHLGEMGYVGVQDMTVEKPWADSVDVQTLRYSQVRPGDRIADANGIWYPVYDSQVRFDGEIALTFQGSDRLYTTTMPATTTVTAELYSSAEVYGEFWDEIEASRLRSGDVISFHDYEGRPQNLQVRRVEVNQLGMLVADARNASGLEGEFMLQPRELVHVKTPLCVEERAGIIGEPVARCVADLRRGDMVQTRYGAPAVVNRISAGEQEGSMQIEVQILQAGRHAPKTWTFKAEHPVTVFENQQKAEAARVQAQAHKPERAVSIETTGPAAAQEPGAQSGLSR